MGNYSGVVRKVFKNNFKGTDLYSFTLDSDKTFYNLGRKAPVFSEGQSIKFDGDRGKRQGNVDVLVDSIEISSETSVKAEDYSMSSQSGARRSAEVLTKDKYWENREANDVKVQKVIQIQAARNAAIALYSAMKPDGDPEEFIHNWTDKFLANNDARLSA